MTSAVRLIRSQQLTQTAPYAYAATTAVPARGVWVAGACPLDEQGSTVAPGDYAAQAHQVMRNLAVALAEAGAALTDVVKTTVYVASPGGRTWLRPGPCTASTWAATTPRARCSASPCSATTTS
jgi:enamine deaminase RidA (YjgF/YER057c/UK114 family)